MVRRSTFYFLLSIGGRGERSSSRGTSVEHIPIPPRYASIFPRDATTFSISQPPYLSLAFGSRPSHTLILKKERKKILKRERQGPCRFHGGQLGCSRSSRSCPWPPRTETTAARILRKERQSPQIPSYATRRPFNLAVPQLTLYFALLGCDIMDSHFPPNVCLGNPLPRRNGFWCKFCLLLAFSVPSQQPP